MTGIYGLAHMTVDLSCAFLMYCYIWGEEQWYLWLLLYNFCAFAMQMPVGAAADCLGRNGEIACIGCLGAAAGLFLGAAGYAAAASVAAGLGNACFHVGGGLAVMNRSSGRASDLGLFVAPGAAGIYWGSLLGKEGPGMPAAALVAAVLFLSAGAVLAMSLKEDVRMSSGNAPAEWKLPGREILKAAACFFLAVVLRSYSGMAQEAPWRESLAHSGLFLTAAMVAGKAAGGLLGDRLGKHRAACISMGAAAVGFFLFDLPAAGILAVFFWNMSMPLTLWAVLQVFPGAKGFGFGLLTFGLFLGFCPVYLGAGGLRAPALGTIALASLILLNWGLRRVEI